MSKEEFLREISKTVKLSIDSNKITYLFFTNNVFLQSHKCGRDRLFEAYPGGRKVFSMSGVKLAKDLGLDLR